MLIRHAIGLLLIPVLLAGCQSMSESECKVADWGRVGFDDGARGVHERRIAAYAEDCGKIGVQPNAAAYRQGWDAGIKRFCTAASGWRAGLDGQADKEQVCLGQPGFERFSYYLNAGLQVYRTRERIRENNQETNRLQKKLESPGTDEEKRRIRRRLHDIDRDQYHLRTQMGEQQMLAP